MVARDRVRFYVHSVVSSGAHLAGLVLAWQLAGPKAALAAFCFTVAIRTERCAEDAARVVMQDLDLE